MSLPVKEWIEGINHLEVNGRSCWRRRKHLPTKTNCQKISSFEVSQIGWLKTWSCLEDKRIWPLFWLTQLKRLWHPCCSRQWNCLGWPWLLWGVVYWRGSKEFNDFLLILQNHFHLCFLLLKPFQYFSLTPFHLIDFVVETVFRLTFKMLLMLMMPSFCIFFTVQISLLLYRLFSLLPSKDIGQRERKSSLTSHTLLLTVTPALAEIRPEHSSTSKIILIYQFIFSLEYKNQIRLARTPFELNEKVATALLQSCLMTSVFATYVSWWDHKGMMKTVVRK